MLYRFKCKATGDVVMLENNGKRLLEILGKDPSRPGILLNQDMPQAIQTLCDAVFEDECEFERLKQEALARGEELPDPERVSLRTRVAPFIDMLQHCMREGCEVVWGV